MSRRTASDGEAILGLLVIVVIVLGATITMWMPVISAVLIYGLPIAIASCLAVFELESRPHPNTRDQQRSWYKVVYLDEDTLRLNAIGEQQRQCRTEKINFYWKGDTHGIDRRGDGRFDERGGQGKLLNRQIGQVEQRFAKLEDEKCEVNYEALNRHRAQFREFSSWRSWYARAISARWALVAYGGSALLLTLVGWTSLWDFSHYIGESMGIVTLQFLFGPLFIASIVAIVAGLVSWNFNRVKDEIYFTSPAAERDSNIARFNKPEEFSEAAYSAHADAD